jgi:dATP pyrophosphohydrolase
VPWDAALYRLETTCSIPTCNFAAAREWPTDLLVIPEYAFAIDCGAAAMRLSDEHSELRWGTYDETRARLHWDSNKTALWELHERLRVGSLGPPLPLR